MSRRRSAAFLVTTLIASMLAIFVAAPTASAATATSLVRCTNTFASTVVFNLPIDLTTTVTDTADNPITSVEEGDSFKVNLTATIPLSEGFIAGVLAQVPTLTNLDVPRVFISIPTPPGVTGAQDLDLTYAPGNVIIASGGVPVPGGVALTSPTISRTFTASAGAGGTNADFGLDPAIAGSAAATAAGGTVWGAGGLPAAIEMDLAIFGGAVNVGFDCSDGGLTQTAGPDTILGTPDDVFAPPIVPNAAFLSVPITAPPVPTVTISDVTGQVVNNAGRSGNVVTFGGPNWAASSNITVEMCDLAETACSAADLSSVSTSITSGTLAGTATITSVATSGARLLRVSTDQTESDTASLLVLGAPQISAPTNAGAGAPITITGTNWNPNSPSTAVTFLGSGPDTTLGTPDDVILGAFPVTVSSTGAFSTTQNVAAGMGLIGAGELGLGYPQPPSPLNPGSLAAISPFAVSANSCTVLNPLVGCTLSQTVLLTTTPGSLSMSQSGGIIDLGSYQLDGQAHVVDGDINTITAIDATGSLLGWDLTATMTDLVTGDGVGNRRIAASNLEWTPACTPIDANGDLIVDGDAAEIADGAAAALDNTVARTLCTAASGGGGGTFTGDAALELLVPANVAAGDYQASMTFLLI